MFGRGGKSGVAVGRDGVRMAVVSGRRTSPRLERWNILPWPGEVLRPSHRELNIVDPAAFVRTVRESHNRLLPPGNRISVSLPDSSGRMQLLELETPFRTRQEGEDLVRWKLKKSISLDLKELHLDYQVVRTRENGLPVVLVAYLARPILTQYEDLLVEAGLEPAWIDFASINLCRLMAPRVELAQECALVSLIEGNLTVAAFVDGELAFCRSKQLPEGYDARRLAQEVGSTFLVYRQQHEGHRLREIFLLAPTEHLEGLSSVITDASGQEPLRTEVDRLLTMPEGSSPGRGDLLTLAASIGAAVRNLS